MSYRLAMDIGGTFTDFVVIDDDRLVLNDAPGGEGRHRGGRGIILDNRVRADNTRLACSYSRLKFASSLARVRRVSRSGRWQVPPRAICRVT